MHSNRLGKTLGVPIVALTRAEALFGPWNEVVTM